MFHDVFASVLLSNFPHYTIIMLFFKISAHLHCWHKALSFSLLQVCRYCADVCRQKPEQIHLKTNSQFYILYM